MLKRIFNYFKNLRYQSTVTYYIRSEYISIKEVYEFVKKQEEILKNTSSKFELVLDPELELNEGEVGKIIMTHKKYKFTMNAVLGFKNEIVYWKLID